jgi:hypothetical protein
MIIHPTSLSATLDATSEAIFYQNNISTSLRHEITSQIISRQCQTGVNTGFFLLYASESEAKVKLFSGESLNTNLAQNHIPMIEAVRILKLLDFGSHAVTHAIELANQRMEKMCYSTFCAKGECKALTIAYLRVLSSDRSGNSASRIITHISNLTNHRDGKGTWGGSHFSIPC